MASPPVSDIQLEAHLRRTMLDRRLGQLTAFHGNVRTHHGIDRTVFGAT